MLDNSQIKNKSLKSIRWATLGMVVPKLISPFINLWLINILNPSDFGLLTIATVIIGFTNILQGFGLMEFIIKEKELSEIRINTVFWSSIFWATFIALTVVVLSPVFSEVYKNNGLLRILPALSVIIILNALQIVQNSLLQKGLEFKRIFFIQLIPLIVLICITVPLALFGWGIWSLVIGQISTGVVSAVIYIFFTGWSPKIIFSMNELKIMFGFGKWVMAEKLIEYLYSNLDIIIVGIYFDITTVGLYSTGKYIITIIYTTINGSIGAISLPMLSHMQNDVSELKIAFFGITKRIVFFNIPIMIGIALLSSKFIPLVFTQKWEGLSLVLSLSVLGEGVFRNVWVQRDIFKLLNKPDVYPKSISINLVFSLIFLAVASKYGIIAFCVVKIINDFLYTFIQFKLTSKLLNLEFGDLFASFKNTLVASFIMTITLVFILIVLKFLGVEINFVLFTLIVFIGTFSYFLTHYVYDRVKFLNFILEFKSVFNFK